MNKTIIPLLLIFLLFISCQDDAPDPCRMIDIELVVINATDQDFDLGSSILGCSVDANPEGRTDSMFSVVAGKKIEETTGTWGANQLLLDLLNSNGSTEVTISNKITKDDEKFIVLITFDGSNFQMEFL